MTLALRLVPYDSGHRDVRMGRGPLHLLEAGDLAARLRRRGHDVDIRLCEAHAPFTTEIGSAFELHRTLAKEVREAGARGAFPLVLSGNCNSSLGAVAGLQGAFPGERVGVVWFDGHGDCNTPETFTGDFLDAMGLSTLTGRCWQALARSIPGFAPIADRDVVMIGAHGADAGAVGILDASEVAWIKRPAARPDVIAHAVTRMRESGVTRLYVHLDVDVLSPATVGKANGFAPEGGLDAQELLDGLAAIADTMPACAFCIASYDPGEDEGGGVLAAALAAIDAVCARADRAPASAAGPLPLA